MNKVKVIFIVILFISGSCNDFLDIIPYPNSPAEIPLSLSFGNTQATICWELGSYYQLAGGYWSQHYATANTSTLHSDIEKYAINEFSGVKPENYESWKNIYTHGVNELQGQLVKAEKDKDWNYFSAITFFQAFTFQLLVDFYGEIPYFSVLQTGIKNESDFHPSCDDGESIYRDLLKRINFALEKLDSEKNSEALENDHIFKGDMQLWKDFGNTLKLKMLLRMSFYDEAFSGEGIREMAAENVSFLSRDAGFDFTSQIGATRVIDGKVIQNDDMHGMNPMYYYEVYRRSFNSIRISATLFNYLNGNRDARLSTFSAGSSSGDTVSLLSGMPQGGYLLSTAEIDPSRLCFFRFNKSQPFYLFSEVESYLLQAESALRGWGKGEVKEFYDNAIRLDFERKGFMNSAAGFTSPGGVYEYPADQSFEEQMEAIMMAKWVALAGTQEAETFFELNRSGYPGISEVPAWEDGNYNPAYLGGKLSYSITGETGGLFPKRLPIPAEEVRLNRNIESSKNISDKIWWDVKIP